jgi:uracil-DNA glycosylase family 4
MLPTMTDAARAMESLLAFWADAGVADSYADAPIDRRAPPPIPMARPAARAAAAAPGAAPRAAPRATLPGVVVEAPPEAAFDIGEARRLSAEASDLPALEAAIGAYDGCALKRAGATQPVIWRGAVGAPVMIIGEAPGADEDAQGQPFVGRAGKLLDKMVAAAGLTGRVFITNTVYWRPPGNRTPTIAEQMSCSPFLERIIALVQPKVLVLAGGASAKSLLQKTEGILSLRGRWFEWTSADGSIALPALPTLHPAFLLRQSSAKKFAWGDFLTLAERVDRPERST